MPGPGGTIFLSIGDDSFPGIGGDNSGNETIFAQNGSDTVLGGLGNDYVYGDAGDDEIFGGDGDDYLQGGDGNDRIEGGLGNDTINDLAGSFAFIDAGDGNDRVEIGSGFLPLSVVNGGAGTDRLTSTAAIVLSNIYAGFEELGSYGQVIYGTAARFEAFGAFFQENGESDAGFYFGLRGPAAVLDLSDELDAGFEKARLRGTQLGDTVTTGSDNDTIFGLGGDDNLTGGFGDDSLLGADGADTLVGGGGYDTLNGGNGNDRIIGGVGRDLLTGGAGADTFFYTAVSDSPVGFDRDTVRDFLQGTDTIDLSAIDAIAGGGDNAFDFKGIAPFNGTAGELRYTFIGGLTALEGDTDGNGVRDFVIIFTGTILFTGGDFIL